MKQARYLLCTRCKTRVEVRVVPVSNLGGRGAQGGEDVAICPNPDCGHVHDEAEIDEILLQGGLTFGQQ